MSHAALCRCQRCRTARPTHRTHHETYNETSARTLCCAVFGSHASTLPANHASSCSQYTRSCRPTRASGDRRMDTSILCDEATAQ